MKHAMIPDAHPFPAIDRNDPEKAKTAIMLEWPETFSDRAKMVIRYFDGTMFPYSYADHIVLTDESLELTAFGDGSPEAPIGFPRYEDNTLEGVEAWLEEVADQYDADGDIAGWEEAKLAYACEQKEAWAKKNLSKLARHGWKLLVDGKPTDFDESLWDRAIKSCRECGCNAIMYSVSRPETDEPSAIAIYKDGHVTERVNEHKSLVDLQLTAGVVTEPWKNNVDGFLLASSDSDFWGLIRSLPSARFMVLLEKDKYGEYLTDALKLNDIGYCIMDDFAGNVEDIKTGAMNKSIETSLTALFLSHWHFDHAADVPVLMYRLEAMNMVLPVYAPEDPDSALFRTVSSAACFDLKVIKPGDLLTLYDAGITVTAARHPVPAVGFRISCGGKDLGYTGDTNTLPSFAEDYRGCSLLLADGLFPASAWAEGKPHLSAELAARLAEEAGVGQLVITHLNPVFPCETLLREARCIHQNTRIAHTGEVLEC